MDDKILFRQRLITYKLPYTKTWGHYLKKTLIIKFIITLHSIYFSQIYTGKSSDLLGVTIEI